MQGPAEADGNIRVRLNGVGVYDPTRLAGADPDPYSSRMVPDDNALNSPRADASAAFRATLDLFQTGVEVMRQNLRRRHPAATDEQVARLLQDWLRNRPGAESGDSAGRPVDLTTRRA